MLWGDDKGRCRTNYDDENYIEGEVKLRKWRVSPCHCLKPRRSAGNVIFIIIVAQFVQFCTIIVIIFILIDVEEHIILSAEGRLNMIEYLIVSINSNNSDIIDKLTWANMSSRARNGMTRAFVTTDNVLELENNNDWNLCLESTTTSFHDFFSLYFRDQTYYQISIVLVKKIIFLKRPHFLSDVIKLCTTWIW